MIVNARIQETLKKEVCLPYQTFGYLTLNIYICADISRCPYLRFKGNGLCDDANNIPECDFDGGDCCGHFKEKGQCEQCACLDDMHNYYENFPQWKCQSSLMYDGVCDMSNKDKSCRFDGFDCEVHALCNEDLLQNHQCDEKANYTQCAWDMGECVSTNDHGNAYLCLENNNLRGDGVCDLLNDAKECNNDNGDCLQTSGKAAENPTLNKDYQQDLCKKGFFV